MVEAYLSAEGAGAGSACQHRQSLASWLVCTMALKPGILRYKRDFSRLYKRGRSCGDRFVVVFHIANGLKYTRKAFLASKKVGGAVERNRARRLMKESFRKLEKETKPGKDILFIARSTIAGCGCAEVEASMRNAMEKSGLLS